MKTSLILFALVGLFVACQEPSALRKDDSVISQRSISNISCGPCALLNWLSSGGNDLTSVLESVSDNRTPKETVKYLINTYGKRQSATKPSVKRYGNHNGGVGSVNLMIMAQELLGDHLEKPPTLRGEYLHRLENESSGEHFDRIVSWFSNSIDSGFPVLFYIRCYHRSSNGKKPTIVFGHHVVITQLDSETKETENGEHRVSIRFADSASGRVERGYLTVSEKEFTAPTFTYSFEKDRVVTNEKLETGRPLLEIRADSYESSNPPKTRIITAHFATFAEIKL